MTVSGTKKVRVGYRWIGILLFTCALSLLTATPARADNCVADRGGVIDGSVNPVAPSQIQIDGNCTIKNFPASNPLTSNISWFGNNPTSWLLIFDNVLHTGNMACNLNSQGNKIWFVNSSSTSVQEHCLSLLIPVEKINKQNPAGQTTATIGVPFTYTLTIPVLFDPATGTIINSSGSPNDLHGITIWDDLNATGADLSYVSHVAYWVNDPTHTPIPHTFSNVGGLLTFDNFPIAPAGQQFVIALTVVLNDSNVSGTQFINTARWDFGRLIDDVFHEPLPGEWGVTPPMTVVVPNLVVTKSGPATMNLGQRGDFVIDVHNDGLGEAWNATIRDLLPDGATGGMCDVAPEILSLQVFAADGVTPVPGKGPLNLGSDYSRTYTTSNCELEIRLLTATGTIGPNERLIVRYRAQLDANTQDGVELTNIAGAIQWFSVDSSNPNRPAYTRTLTNGTEGTLDHEDAHTVIVALTGYYFEKAVANLTSGVNPTTTAAPGNRLRYTLRLRTTNEALTDFRIFDDLDALNAQPAFVPGTLTHVTTPAGADISGTSSTGGTKGTGIIDIRLSVPAASEVLVVYDITLASTLSNGTVVTNQSTLRLANGTVFALSDDPNVNGTAYPDISGDEDPTRVTIVSVTVPPTGYFFEKTVANLTSGVNPTTTAAPGNRLRYTLRLRTTNEALTNFRIFDDLDALNAQPAFVPGTLTHVTTPAGADISGTSSTGGTKGTGIIDIRLSVPAASEVLVVYDITLASTLSNGTVVTNQSTLRSAESGTVFALSDDPNVNGTANPDISGDEDPTRVTIITGNLLYADKRVSLLVDLSSPGIVDPGDVLRYTITVQNSAAIPSTGVVLRDSVPANTTYVANSTLLNGVPVPDSAGLSPLAAGIDISSPDLTPPLPGPSAGTISPGATAVLQFELRVNAGTPVGTVISNQAVADSVELPDLLTDGDGNPATGPEPTVVVVGQGQQLSITKQVVVIGGGAALPGAQLEYVVHVTNTAAVPATNVVITDDLDAIQPGQLAYVNGSATMDGSTAGVTFAGSTITANYAAVNGPLEPGEVVVLRFQATLSASLAEGTVVTNTGVVAWNDPTQTASASVSVTVPPAGYFFEKTAANLTSGVNPTTTAAPGNRLRYTLRLRTTNEALTNFRIFDDLDALNAQPAFVPGTLTHVTTPAGADISGTSSTGGTKGTGIIDIRLSVPAASEVLVVYDITLASTLSNGTVVTNQSTLRLANGTAFALSDDPNVNGTANPDISGDEDPTRVTIITGNLLYADKRVSLLVDLSSPGIVDPGDVLRYTITVQNSAAIPSTGVVLRDSVPANTTYVANSTLLNGVPVPDSAGLSPLAAGIDISSPDLTPPLPGPSAGTISPGATAVLQFELRVNAGTPVGTVISNQAVADSVELPDLLTDGDGNPATGPEPTVVVVGQGQQLSITKQVVVIGGGAALPGAQLEYVVHVTNTAAVPATNVVITDDLDAIQPGQLAYVNGSATMDGSTAGVTFAGSTITANYAAVNGPLEPGEVVVLRFQATLSASLAEGTVVTNTGVVAWNDPTQTASASVPIVVLGASSSGVLSGTAWHDADFDDAQDPGERALAGWAVDLYRDGQLVHSAMTDAAGAYSITGIEPNEGSGSAYDLRFRAPGAGANTATLGSAVSPFTNGPQRITNIIVPSGANLQGLNLPIHPNGVIYDSLARTPVTGATLALLDAGNRSPLPAGCFDDAAQRGQITLAEGYYKFDINFSDPAVCPSGGDYLIEVTPPAGSIYIGGYSQIIPPASDASTAAFSVPACPGSAGDAIPATALFCEVQGSESAPSASVAPRSAGTIHHVHLRLDNSQLPGSSQIFNNHIPLDSQILGSIAISKTTPLLNVTRGQLVPYVITVNNVAGLMLTDVDIVDRFPAGFSYVAGSATIDGVPTEPSIAGRELRWNGLVIAGTQVHTVRLLLAVGAGVTEGEYVNRAQVVNGTTDGAISGEATATVRIVPDPLFDCTDVTGKVFNDVNRNGVQDSGEDGLPGIRVVTARGLRAATDQYGRYHITCAITPHESRGSNFVLKLDDRSLPSGFRLSTDQTQIKRVTRGKAASFNFGASIHRVVAIDLSDAVFEPGTTEVRLQWRPRLNVLLEELRKAPAVLRLSYIADTEDAALVERRVQVLKRQLTEGWHAATYGYVLTIEPEVFWRLGGRPKQPDVRVPGSR